MKHIIGIVCFMTISFTLLGQIRENLKYIDSVSAKIIGLEEFPVKIQEGYYAIISSGEAGNIGVFISDDGILLIDDQWSTLADRIKEFLLTMTNKPISAIINTHYHYDHTNGNLVFAQEKIPIVSHQNARQRMSEKQVLLPTMEFQGYAGIVQKSYPEYALPSITFDNKMTFYKGKEIIELIYFKNAHSDGDIVVHFKNANIFHTGDIFVTYGLPYIDENVGGNIYDMIAAIDQLLLMSDDKTKFIPGHGPLCTKKELEEYKNLLTLIRDNVETMVKGNYNVETILKDTRDKIHYENNSGDKFIEQVLRAVKNHLSAAKNK
jgi:cyclase